MPEMWATRSGRTFERSDTREAPLVAVIDETFANRFFPGQDPIGRSVVYPWNPPVSFEVVGVVGDVRLGDGQLGQLRGNPSGSADVGRPDQHAPDRVAQAESLWIA